MSTLDDETNTLSRNVGKQLRTDEASYPGRMDTSLRHAFPSSGKALHILAHFNELFIYKMSHFMLMRLSYVSGRGRC
jgi:hypothetical protein